MSYLSVIVRRLIQTIPIMFGVSILTFGVLNLLPGDTAAAILGENATSQSLAILNRKLGLDRPFVVRYFDWLHGLITGHLGISLSTSQPISTILATRVPVSVELALLAFVEALVISIPLALLAAWRADKLTDHVIVNVGSVGLSFPPFVFALILVLVFSLKLHWLPVTGYVPISAGPGSNLRDMLLPSFTISFGLICGYLRLLRADLIDQMNGEGYIELARAKGLRRWGLLTRHALRNSLFSLLTVIGLHLGTIISGTVIVETIFGLPGVGQELFSSITLRDAPVVEAIVVILALTVVMANLVTDLLYSVLDPRVRYGRSSS